VDSPGTGLVSGVGNSYRGGGAAGTTDTTTFAVIGGLALNLYTEAVGWIGGQWVLTGPNFDGPTLPSVQISPDTLTWTAVATPMDGNQFPRNAVVDGDGLAVILATGANFGDITCMSSSDDGASWSSHYSPFDYPGSGGSNSCRDALLDGDRVGSWSGSSDPRPLRRSSLARGPGRLRSEHRDRLAGGGQPLILSARSMLSAVTPKNSAEGDGEQGLVSAPLDEPDADGGTEEDAAEGADPAASAHIRSPGR